MRLCSFNPRSSRSRGATCGGGLHRQVEVLFQPTLLAFTRSDRSFFSTSAPAPMFQPTLLAFTRSDFIRPPFGAFTSMFQPTLLAFTRSDLRRALLQGRVLVSTHAPRVHEERPAPLFRSCEHLCFNPRSSRSRGATFACPSSEDWSAFQPTLLAFTRSDNATQKPVPPAELFQPTLLAFTRSDGSTPPARRSSPVSTHAPRVHEERRMAPARGVVGGEFQPTLLAFTRSDNPSRLPNTSFSVGFNPRSSRSRGATSPRHPTGATPCFNPRSSRSRGATSPATAHCIICKRFQPTLLAFTRSDWCRRIRSGAGQRFNPRSSRSRGATLSASSVVPLLSFQPTLLAFTRSDDFGVCCHEGVRQFQPTLLAFTRSDEACALWLAPKLVSPPAPRVHAVRRDQLLRIMEVLVSTHAPRVHEERPGRCGPGRCAG